MASDQNSSVSGFRIGGGEGRIAAVSSSVRPTYVVAAPPPDYSLGTVQVVYYQMLDGRLLGVPSHGATGWVPQGMPFVVGSGLVNNAPSLGARGNDSPDLIQFTDQQDFQAVRENLGGGGVGGIAREESTASSGFSGTDAIGSCGEINRMPSNGGESSEGSSVYSQEATSKTTGLDQGMHISSSTGALGVQVMSGLPPSMPIHMDHGVERYVTMMVPYNHGNEMQPPRATFPVSSPYLQAYGDPPQEIYYPSHQGNPAHIMRAVQPVVQQQQIAPGVTPQQFIPMVYETMPPSSDMSVRPYMFPALIQPQQFQRVDNTSGQRVLQIPVAYNSYHTQVSPQVFQGGYERHQVPHQEQVASSEGWMLNQQGAVSGNVSELGPTAGLQTPISMVAASIPQMYQDNAVLPVGIPMQCKDNAVLPLGIPIQCNIKQEVVSSRPANEDHPIIAAMSSPLSDNHLYESSKHNYSNISSMVSAVKNQESFGAYDHQKLTERGMANLQIHPAEIIPNNVQNKLSADSLKREDVQGNRLSIGGEGETSRTTNFQDHHTTLGGDKLNQIEILPVSASESPYSHNVRPTEFHEVAQSPFISNPHMHSHGKPDSYALHEEINPASSRPQPYGKGDVEYSSNSLFSHQDPSNFQLDTQLPPPMPKSIHLKMKVSDARIPAEDAMVGFPERNGGEVITERRLEVLTNQVSSNAKAAVNSESAQSNKVSGSAKKSIKQELQAVAEGVAASAFQSPAQSQKNTDMQVENEDHLEEVEATVSEKMKIRSPLSKSIGRMQVIENTDLEELRELGSGAFGTVYHGKWRGTDVAIKRINHRCFSGNPSEQDRMRDDFWNEAINLADMHHPNVVAFYGVSLDGPEGSVATVTEYMVDGSLRRALQRNGRNFDKRNQLLIAMDIAFGMEYLHEKKVVHFDLKSDNLLVNLRDPDRPICKVADLGLSKVKRQTFISGGLQGTLQWMAPELLDGNSTCVSEKVDVYSFGIVMWELLTSEEPYADLSYGTLIGGIASNTLRPDIPESCDLDWRSLMERCWSAEPAERPSFTEVSKELRTMASKHLKRDKCSKLKNGIAKQ